MKRLALSLVLALLGTIYACAQATHPQREIFAGASYFHARIRGLDRYEEGVNLYGWQASPDWNVHKKASVFLDFGGQYQRGHRNNLYVYQYMIGPRLKLRTRGFTAFVHGMAGGGAAHVGRQILGAFAFGGGGGLDVNLGEHVALRLVQIDSLHSIKNGFWGHHMRISFGIVFKIRGPR